MTDYTPGPWRITEHAMGHPLIVADYPPAHALPRATGDVVLASPGPHDNPELREANARLIAAAPDLLAALELALSDFDNYGEVWQSDDEYGVNFYAINAIRDAIAKARGEN